MKKIKIEFDLEKLNEDELFILFEKTMMDAEADYTKKKKLKGEEVNPIKLNNALNQRKDCKMLAKLVLAKRFHRGNILQKEAIFKVADNLKKEAEVLVNK